MTALVSTSLFFVGTYYFFKDTAKSILVNSAIKSIEALAHTIEAVNGIEDIQRVVAAARADDLVEDFYLIDSENMLIEAATERVVIGSRLDSLSDRSIDRNAIEEVLNSGKTIHAVDPTTLKISIYALAIMINQDSMHESRHIAAATYNANPLSQQLTRLATAMLTAGCILVFCFVGVVVLLTNRIVVNPLVKFTNFVRNSKGQRGVRYETTLTDDEFGELFRVYNNMRDREETQQKTIEDQRISIIETSRMSSLGLMAGGVAHEINNPLTIIIGKTHALRRLLSAQPQNQAAISQNLDTIASTAQRIADIVSGLRSLSRDSTNDNFVSVCVRDVIDSLLGLCSERFKAHDIRLDVHVEELLCFNGRHAQIGQVLMNLLNNSFDAVTTLNEKWIRLDARSEGNWINIKITDSGKGIASEIQTKIMLPFFTTKEVGKGTGLGLSISRNIAEQHGGTLELDTSSENTCFIVKIPLAKPLDKVV